MASSKEGNKQSGSRGTSSRGFASMDPERQREIASEGGKAAHQKGTAHEFTSEEARRAGSMSHGNRQSDQAGTGSGGTGSRQGGGKQESASKQQGGDKMESGTKDESSDAGSKNR